jgi:hypothetical protein
MYKLRDAILGKKGKNLDDLEFMTGKIDSNVNYSKLT